MPSLPSSLKSLLIVCSVRDEDAEHFRQVAARHRPELNVGLSFSIGSYTQAQWDEYYRTHNQRGQYSQAEWDAWNRSRRY